MQIWLPHRRLHHLPAAGISYVGYTTVTNASASLDLTAISGLQAGDLVICASAIDNTQGAVNLPSGYTNIKSGTVGYVDVRMCCKLMPATPDSSVTVKTSSSYGASIGVAFRGVDQTTPIDVAAPSGSASMNPPAITTVTDGAMVVCAAWADDGVTQTTAGPTGYNFVDGILNTTGFDIIAAFAWAIKATAGSENPDSFNGGGVDEAAVVGAIRPAA